MGKSKLPQPDKNGIIKALPDKLSEQNMKRINKFSTFMFLYDFVQDHFVRPHLHKADPKKHREILKSLISPVKHSRVLDTACGAGGAIPHFDRSNEYTGLDLSYSMLKLAVKKANKKSFQKSVFIQGTAEELLFDDESFDFILIDTALHMIPNYQSAISETARVLTKNGTFVCSTPAVGIIKEFDTTWNKIANKRNLHSFTQERIDNICSRNGLSFRRINTKGGVIYFQAQKT